MDKFFSILGIVLLTATVSAKKHFVDLNPELRPDLLSDGLEIKAKIGQFLEITCPQYDQATPANEMHLFYLYDIKEEKDFHSCNLGDNMIILSCDSPYTTTKLTLKFQKTSPYPLAFTFQDGKTYHYLAIPKGEADCSNAMRLKVKIDKEKTVVPPVEPVGEETPKKPKTSPTTTTTTTTRRSRPASSSTKRIKEGNTGKQTGGGNGATSVRQFTFLTLSLMFFTLWKNA